MNMKKLLKNLPSPGHFWIWQPLVYWDKISVTSWHVCGYTNSYLLHKNIRCQADIRWPNILLLLWEKIDIELTFSELNYWIINMYVLRFHSNIGVHFRIGQERHQFSDTDLKYQLIFETIVQMFSGTGLKYQSIDLWKNCSDNVKNT